MEQQPGPVNWAQHNTAPLPGMVRLWTWQALAQGAEVVSYFRWRQVPYAQEQMHAGLNRPDNVLDRGGQEAARVAQELAGLDLRPMAKAQVALVADLEMEWMTRFLPQSLEFRYKDLLWGWYAKLRSLGPDVDIVPPGADLSGYKLTLVPSLGTASAAAVASFRAAGGPVLYGPRTGWKTTDFAIPGNLAPGLLQELIPLKVVRVDTSRADVRLDVEGQVSGATLFWREFIESDLVPLARFLDRQGAFYAAGPHHYLAGWPDDALLNAAITHVAKAAGLFVTALPRGLRLQRRGALTFALNVGPDTVTAPAPAEARFHLGTRQIPPQDLAVWSMG